MDSRNLWIMPYQTKAGVHTFTCEATNSAGVTSKKDFKVEVVNDESGLPDDWSRDEIRDALQNGIFAPQTLERIDAPVTRSQFARQMSFLFGAFSTREGIYPSFNKEGLVTDCGDNDLLEAMMVYLGVMEAPGGIFGPTKPLTEREAALIMYKAAVMAQSPETTIDQFNDDEVIRTLEEIGVLEDSGPNVYQADNKLSNRLSMVRSIRLMNYYLD